MLCFREQSIVLHTAIVRLESTIDLLCAYCNALPQDSMEREELASRMYDMCEELRELVQKRQDVRAMMYKPYEYTGRY